MEKIRAIIVEDEQYAAEALLALLADRFPQIEILVVLDSVRSAVNWLGTHPQPMLIFMDIQLGDGQSFAIFDRVEVAAPVIFTTAYDNYMLEAFRVNSLQYLLKPIEKQALVQAIEKFEKLRAARSPAPDWAALLQNIAPKLPVYRTRFAVQSGEILSHISVADIAYFEGDDRYVMLVTRAGKRFIIDYLLRDLEALLDPARFFRLNRSFIAQLDGIESVVQLSKSKLLTKLRPAAKREVVVSAATASHFKAWLDEGQAAG